MPVNPEISYFVENFVAQCDKKQIKEFNKNDIITTYIEKRNQLCILIERRSRFN